MFQNNNCVCFRNIKVLIQCAPTIITLVVFSVVNNLSTISSIVNVVHSHVVT